MRKFLLLVLLVALAAVPTFAQEDMAYVRAAHLSVDAGLVDVFVNGEATLLDVEAGTVSDWMAVEAGAYDIDIVPAGGTLAESLLSATYNVGAGDWTTAVVHGYVGDGSVTLQAVVEDLTDVAEGETRISMFNAVPSLPPINVFASDVELVHLLSYPGMMGPESDGFASTDVVAGTYALSITNSEDDLTLADLGEIVMGAGRNYFVALFGARGATQYVLASTDVAGMSMMEDDMSEVETGEGSLMARIAHFSISAPEIDVYVGGELVAAGLDFPDVTDYASLEAGIYEVALVPAGADLSEAVYTGEIALFADSVTLVAAVGLPDNETLEVVTALENSEPTVPGEARISFFQAIPTDALFDLVLNDSVLIQGVAFPEIFDGAGDGYATTDIIAARYGFGIESAVAGVDLNVGNITMGSGRHYLIAAVGTTGLSTYVVVSGDVVAP